VGRVGWPFGRWTQLRPRKVGTPNPLTNKLSQTHYHHPHATLNSYSLLFDKLTRPVSEQGASARCQIFV